jgi:hypothetical protein
MFKKKSYPVHPRDLEAFAKLPVVLAVLIDAEYITHWPHAWTRDGNRSRKRHADHRGRGYDAEQVFSEANWKLYYHGAGSAEIKPLPPGQGHLYQRIGLMRGEVQDAEEGDLA